MYEEDHAPVALNITLSEIYHQAASSQQTIDLATDRQLMFKRFLPIDLIAEIKAIGARVLVVSSELSIHNSRNELFRPGLRARIGQLLANWRAAGRDLNPMSRDIFRGRFCLKFE